MIIAIIPFRDRHAQLETLVTLLKNRKDIDLIHVIEQTPGLPFNRGWVRNIGALVSNVKQATLYFIDVDLYITPNFQNFKQLPLDVALHCYGHPHCLGTLFGIRVETFIKIILRF